MQYSSKYRGQSEDDGSYDGYPPLMRDLARKTGRPPCPANSATIDPSWNDIGGGMDSYRGKYDRPSHRTHYDGPSHRNQYSKVSLHDQYYDSLRHDTYDRSSRLDERSDPSNDSDDYIKYESRRTRTGGRHSWDTNGNGRAQEIVDAFYDNAGDSAIEVIEAQRDRGAPEWSMKFMAMYAKRRELGLNDGGEIEIEQVDVSELPRLVAEAGYSLEELGGIDGLRASAERFRGWDGKSHSAGSGGVSRRADGRDSREGAGARTAPSGKGRRNNPPWAGRP